MLSWLQLNSVGIVEYCGNECRACHIVLMMIGENETGAGLDVPFAGTSNGRSSECHWNSGWARTIQLSKEISWPCDHKRLEERHSTWLHNNSRFFLTHTVLFFIYIQDAPVVPNDPGWNKWQGRTPFWKNRIHQIITHLNRNVDGQFDIRRVLGDHTLGQTSARWRKMLERLNKNPQSRHCKTWASSNGC